MGNTYDNDISRIGGLPYVASAVQLPENYEKPRLKSKSKVRPEKLTIRPAPQED